jgi:hypothetical protein
MASAPNSTFGCLQIESVAFPGAVESAPVIVGSLDLAITSASSASAPPIARYGIFTLAACWMR